jgi:diaminopimelate decarboxylase
MNMQEVISSTECSYIHNIWTREHQFYGNTNPVKLIEKYGSPLYVYNENILREQCNKVKNIVSYPNLKVNYSAKANTNLSILKIIRDEGLLVDAMSPGEIYIELKAGYKPEEILFICNNVSADEMKFAINAGVLVSVDSLSQLETYGKLNKGGKVVVRINPGVGAGHHEKVVTGGKNTKFGVNPEFINELKAILTRYELHLVGINQHIGSLFLTADSYIEAATFLLSFAESFPELEFIDFGGGFGIPYHKELEEKPLDLRILGGLLQATIYNWIAKNKRQITIKLEPGRFIVAECGVLLGQVHATKRNGEKRYVGTDIGFNVLIRPAMYNSHHDIEVYSSVQRNSSTTEPVTIVGNICETGDIIAKDRNLPPIMEGDIIGILDSGAYGTVMSSNYNCRLKPAEVLITSNGDDVLIRKREELEDLMRYFPDK